MQGTLFELISPPSASTEMYWAYEQFQKIRLGFELFLEDVATGEGISEDLQDQIDTINSTLITIQNTLNGHGDAIADLEAAVLDLQDQIDALIVDVSTELDKKLNVIEGGTVFGWRDVTGVLSVRGSGASSPPLDVFRDGIYLYRFSQLAGTREFYAQFSIPHDYKPGSVAYLSVSFAVGNSAIAGNVKWDCEFTCAKGHAQGADSVFAATTTMSQTAAVAVNSNYRQHTVRYTTAVPAAKLEPNAVVLARFSRDNTVGGNFAASVFLVTADLRYQFDRMGTKNMEPDFYV